MEEGSGMENIQASNNATTQDSLAVLRFYYIYNLLYTKNKYSYEI